MSDAEHHGRTHEVELHGCTPEPLMNYLKALGILRLVAEDRTHGDLNARGFWRNDEFVLRSHLDETALENFFLNHYKPTPIVVPWSGGDFFAVDWDNPNAVFAKTPTAGNAIAAVLCTTSHRLAPYRESLAVVRTAMKKCGVLQKNDINPEQKSAKAKAKKAAFVQHLRMKLSDNSLPWLDAATAMASGDLWFAPLLGSSGGGSDGNTHFSDNFMQNLWDALPDFDEQRNYAVKFKREKASTELEVPKGELGILGFEWNRKRDALTITSCLDVKELVDRFCEMNATTDKAAAQKHIEAQARREVIRRQSKDWICAAMFRKATDQLKLVRERTSSLFDSGAVGGPNATQGMERDSMSNPWDVILGLEGTLCFAAAAVKRLASDTASAAAFPFQFDASPTSRDGLAAKEASGREVWLPMWSRPATMGEIHSLLAEGRAEAGNRPARSGIDMARSIAMLGVDRGVGAFSRYAIVKGRVGGDNYNTAASLGRFAVTERPAADLLREVDSWLDTFRRACGDKTPPRISAMLRTIDAAVFDFCRYGGATHFTDILISLGATERVLANAEKFREEKEKIKLDPLAGLSAKWIETAWPHKDSKASHEFQIALALAGIRNEPGEIGPLRSNLEPVSIWHDKDQNKQRANWAEKDRAVVWNGPDLSANLAAVLARRVMDGQRNGCVNLPLAPACARCVASPEAVAAFFHGELDDRRIADLLWGLMLVDVRKVDLQRLDSSRCDGEAARGTKTNFHEQVASLPPVYCLLKLLFLPRALDVSRSPQGEVRWRLATPGERGTHSVRPEPAVLSLLRAGRVGEAAKIAMRRLRAAGLTPLPHRRSGGPSRDDEWLEGQTASHRGQREGRRLAAALLIPIDARAVDALVQRATRGDDVDTPNEPPVESDGRNDLPAATAASTEKEN